MNSIQDAVKELSAVLNETVLPVLFSIATIFLNVCPAATGRKPTLRNKNALPGFVSQNAMIKQYAEPSKRATS